MQVVYHISQVLELLLAMFFVFVGFTVTKRNLFKYLFILVILTSAVNVFQIIINIKSIETWLNSAILIIYLLSNLVIMANIEK